MEVGKETEGDRDKRYCPGCSGVAPGRNRQVDMKLLRIQEGPRNTPVRRRAVDCDMNKRVARKGQIPDRQSRVKARPSTK